MIPWGVLLLAAVTPCLLGGECSCSCWRLHGEKVNQRNNNTWVGACGPLRETHWSGHGLTVLFKLDRIHMIKCTETHFPSYAGIDFPLMRQVQKIKTWERKIFPWQLAWCLFTAGMIRLHRRYFCLVFAGIAPPIADSPNSTSITRCRCGPCLSLNKKIHDHIPDNTIDHLSMPVHFVPSASHRTGTKERNAYLTEALCSRNIRLDAPKTDSPTS